MLFDAEVVAGGFSVGQKDRKTEAGYQYEFVNASATLIYFFNMYVTIAIVIIKTI